MTCNTGKYNFKPRNPYLLSLEGNHGRFIISCRHRDILRASTSKHFRSCYSKDGINRHIPARLCTNPDIAIVGEKDKAGDWLWRAFIRYSRVSIDYVEPRYDAYDDWIRETYSKHNPPMSKETRGRIEMFRIYGNCNLNVDAIKIFLQDYGIPFFKYSIYDDAV
jgi:hypothetical protein